MKGTAPTEGGPVLLRVLGPLTAVRGGVALTGRELSSRKGRRMLAVLLVERGGLVPADRLVDVLWPEGPPADPAAGVATLVSRLRALLGPESIAGSRAAYGLLRGGPWTADLDQARELTDEAETRLDAGEPGLAAAAAARVGSDLASHLGLDDLADEDWLLPLRDEVRVLRRRASHVSVVAALRTGVPAAVQDLAERAHAADPFDEQAARDLMAVLSAAGEHARALTTFADLARLLRVELGTDPQRQTRDLHLALLRGAPPDLAGARPSPSPPPPRPLLGRGTEVEALRQAWTAAVVGRPSLVTVTGPGGIGKSRLLGEVVEMAEATGGQVLSARCHPAERSLFLQPVVDALRPALVSMSSAALQDLLGPDEDVWRLLLPELVGPQGEAPAWHQRSADLERHRAYQTVARVLTGIAHTQPVLFLLDDAHDAGLVTLDLLDHLTRHLAPAPVLLVAAARDAEVDPMFLATGEGRVRLHLGALPDSAVRAMADAAGQGGHADEIVDRTRGHALSVVEMLRALAAGDPGVPGTLRDAVLQRVARSGPVASRLVRAAAVLGSRIDPQVLARMLDRSDLDVVHDCESLTGSALLGRTETGYEFANDLVQEVVYADLAPALRLAQHRRAADLLAHVPEEMARHAEAAGDDERAARGWLLAGQRAVGQSAAEDALPLLDRGLRCAGAAGAPDLQVRLLLARATARESLTAFPEALVDLDEALARARRTGDRRLEMTALTARGGDVPVALHHPAASWGEYLTRGLALAGEVGDRRVAAELGARLAVLSVSSLRFDDAETYAERAVAAGRASGDEHALAAGLDGLKSVRAYLGDGPALATVLAELLPLVRRTAGAWVLSWCLFEQSFVAMAEGDVDTARAQVAEAVEVNVRSGFPAHAVFFRAHAARFARLAGDLDTALVEGRAALAEAADVDHPWWLASAAGLLAATLIQTGSAREAAAVARTGWDVVAGQGDEAYQLLTLAPLAQATGHPDLVAGAAARLGAIRTPPGQAWLLGADAYLATAQALAATGDEAAAVRVLGPLLAATSPTRWPPVHTAALALSETLRAAR